LYPNPADLKVLFIGTPSENMLKTSFPTFILKWYMSLLSWRLNRCYRREG
jgi:hypothetical protein